MRIGYTSGVFDLFHIGHLNLLKNAKSMCDKLIVGVTTDDLVSYKGKIPMIPFGERMEIVRSIRYVDAVIPQEDMDKLSMCKKLKADVMFVGDDWYNTEKWNSYENMFKEAGIKIIYFPYTKGVSTTKIGDALNKARGCVPLNEEVNRAASSFLMYRALTDSTMLFSPQYPPRFFSPPSQRLSIYTIDDIDRAIKTVINEAVECGGKVALALSGGIDSAIVAKYLPKGSLAYTFRCVADGAIDETEKAREYADLCGLDHKIIDITWDDYLTHAPVLMKHKGAPIHSIEPQIYKGALAAKADGVTHLIFAESADVIFGGMDGLLSRDWTFDEFVNRYTYVMPNTVLKNGFHILAPFEEYRTKNGIDFYRFMNDYYYRECNSSYENACSAAGIVFTSPFNRMVLKTPLDYGRIRAGEPKYMLRELFGKLYNVLEIPNKTPMPRSVGQWLKNWNGPTRPEFIQNCTDGLEDDQKWLVFILEMFMNILDAEQTGKL